MPRKSDFPADTSIPTGSTFDFVINGQNFKIAKEDLLTALGVTGTLEQSGGIGSVPVLDVDGDNYKIRNISVGGGLNISIGPNNEIMLSSQDFSGITNYGPLDNAAILAIVEPPNQSIAFSTDDFINYTHYNGLWYSTGGGELV